MRVVTGDEMTALDRVAQRDYGLPAAALMERAGTAVAHSVATLLQPQRLADSRVHILCGRGNNGGDGLVAARNLANWGARVRLFMFGGSRGLGKESASFLQAARKMEIPILQVGDSEIKKLGYTLRTADVIVDALIGTGVNGSLRPLLRSAVEAINDARRPVVAVDLPTGVDANTGHVADAVVRADLSVTFGLPKVGHLLDPGRTATGRLEVADIGFPAPLVTDEGVGPAHVWIRSREAGEMLRPRPHDGHKGTFGRVVVIAGSVGMAGAALFTLQGALRSGAGLALWAGPSDLLETVQQRVPEATALVIPGPHEHFSKAGARPELECLREGDVLALGPGLGRGADVEEGVFEILREAPVPVVVDADALNAIAVHATAGAGKLPSEGVRVLTPHPKEAARLLNSDAERIEEDRLRALAKLVHTWESTVLLKGSPTLIQDIGGMTAINGSGNVSLATGGTGDVLTGVIAALLAQGYEPWKAAALGAYVHGRAGELAGAAKSRHSVLASDVALALTNSFLELEGE